MFSKTKDIGYIQFGLYSSDEVIKNSVCKITNNKLSGEGSVYDERMGTLEFSKNCPSCGKENKECPGHFGHIELNFPIIHPMYYRMVVNFLKCFCTKCNKFILTEEHLQLDGILKYQKETRFNKIIEKVEKIDICYHCNTAKSKIVFISIEGNIYYVVKKSKILVNEDDIKKIFDNVDNDTVKLLGFEPSIIHPKNLILTTIPILPPISRPYIVTDEMTCDDDLTIQYLEIIKANKNLEDKNINEIKFQKSVQTLKFRLKTLMNNSNGRARHSSGRPIKAIKERISGKEGVIRSNLNGKRVDQSARTVIGPDPSVRVDELVVPQDVAKILTIPERVYPYNKQELEKLISEDKCAFVVKSNNMRINLKYATVRRGTEILDYDIILRDDKEILVQDAKKFILKETDKIKRETKEGFEYENVVLTTRRPYKLEIGDIVERYIRNGDTVLLNRQPTLHAGSMLAKKIIIRPGKTFRFNLAATKTFNADFDGDEMNIHLYQDYDARAELELLSATKSNYISPQATKSNVSIIQDSLLGAYLMTRDDSKIDKDLFYNICMHGDNWSADYILKKIQHIRKVQKSLGKKILAFNGKGLVSMMLPDDFYYEKKSDAYSDQPVVLIYKGVMLEGAFNKSILGSSHNSIIQTLYKQYGVDVSASFVNNIQFIANAWLVHRGFTISIKDCMPKNRELITETVQKSLLEAKSISETNQHPKIIEAKINNTFSKAKDIGLRISKEAMSPDNGFVSTVTSGSRGDYFNIAQITGILGQTNVSGQRIQPVLNKGKRTLPHYQFKETDIERQFESRGFIKNSFMKGLNPKEYWFHAMSGREGVSDTALKTAQSGYIQRKMVKVMEDVQVKYDGTVRNSSNNIIQWAYGGDGLDRTTSIVMNDKTEICDVMNIAKKLNKKFENKN